MNTESDHPERPTDSLSRTIQYLDRDVEETGQAEVTEKDWKQAEDFDRQTRQDRGAEKLEQLRIQTQTQQTLLDQLKEDQGSRKRLLWCFWWLTVVWTIYLMVLIGFSSRSDQLLMVLLGTTTANVFGFMLIATKYLFDRRQGSV